MLMQSKWAGYTVVETMIVLAVTSGIFLSAIMLFQGQQGKAQFTDAMRDIQSKMQDWGNDVSSGFYPDTTTGYKCTLQPPPSNKVQISNAGASLGTNTDCIYIGKVIQFRANSDQVSAYTIFGNRLIPGDDKNIATSLDEAQPVVAYNSIDGANLTENYTLKWGAQAKSVPTTCTVDSSCPTYTIALYHSIGSTPSGGTSSSLFYMYNLGGRQDFASIGAVDDCVQAKTSNCPAYPSATLNKAQICFQSATSNQYAKLILTPSGDSINTNLVYVSGC